MRKLNTESEFIDLLVVTRKDNSVQVVQVAGSNQVFLQFLMNEEAKHQRED